MKFIKKSYESITPVGNINTEVKTKVSQLYKKVGLLIEKAHFKKALKDIFEFVRYANKYFDEERPWIQIKEEKSSCDDTMATCVYIISNLAQLLNPFLPFSSKKVKEMLGLDELGWEEIEPVSVSLSEIKPLFDRIDLVKIEEELERLNKSVLKE